MRWQAIVYNVGRVRRPILTAQERLPAHRAEVQSFARTYRAWATGVNSVMVPVGMEPRVVEVCAGYNVWLDPSQGFYWVDGFEPAFGSPEEARAFALTQVPSIMEPEVARGALPYALIIGVVSMLM